MVKGVSSHEGWREIRQLALNMVAKTNPEKAKIIGTYEDEKELEYRLFVLAVEQGKMDEYKAIEAPPIPSGLDMYHDAQYTARSTGKPMDEFLLRDYKLNIAPVLEAREKVLAENQRTQYSLTIAGMFMDADNDMISKIVDCLRTFSHQNTRMTC